MLGLHIPGLRRSLLTLAGLLLASGVAWAHGGGGGGHGGGGHGGGGHGGGIGQVGGSHRGGMGHIGGTTHHGVGVYGNGSFGIGSIYPYYGLGFGRGYGQGMTYGGYGLGYGLGYPYYGYGFSFGGGYPYYGSAYSGASFPSYGGRYGTGAYPYASGGVSGSRTPLTNSSFYAPTTRYTRKDDMAHLLLIVPENAELWFNGTKSKQTGPQREFVSPALTPGKRYSYDIKAQWTENGKTVEQTRTAHVQANTWQTLDFTKPEPSAETTK